MKFIKFIVIFFAIIAYFVSVRATVNATDNNILEVTCLNPTGSVRVSYSSGTHGIVGDSKNYQGKDTVYTIKDDQLMQCFCEESGNGIQTDWKKVSSLSSDEAKILKSKGFIEVPSGAPWGLDDSPYMAKNLNYNCKSNSNSTLVQSSKGNIEQLASTGNIIVLLTLLTLGILFTSFGIILRKKGN